MEMHEIDFLIIGATKSATTWLQQSLQQDPNIFMPDPELHYFSRYYDRGDEWYLSNFEQKKKQCLAGEKSNSYMDTPEAAERIKQKLPRALLIAQLRNPVDRAYSDYCMLYRRAEVSRDIAQYLDPRRGAGGRFLNGGLYFQQLQSYLDRFPAEQLLVLLYEDMKVDAGIQLDRVRKFLKAADDLPVRPLEKKVKDKSEPIINPTLRRLLRPLKPVVAPFRKNAGFRKLRSLTASEVEYAPLSRDLRERMTDYYAAEIEKLGAIVGKDLNGWLRNQGARLQ
ncbi:sulfotransferase domain-containing protein [Sinorhizobium numidicum]|uniref:Sulfotransferase domain-containing protein n=1 Tax=Sinorhizobium numidicum TaxID=680248 RepID=A0ABY8CSI7_9HYPH|nr:sulfotransferase [Sinorhizobium numidicum]WEX75606.1 sulfotransferase domain-containing protein [Sinorhizobium numidicum]WEX81603.1 sulfotransferase domain-containing protein [Sinorhizobium numidicum]